MGWRRHRYCYWSDYVGSRFSNYKKSYSKFQIKQILNFSFLDINVYCKILGCPILYKKLQEFLDFQHPLLMALITILISFIGYGIATAFRAHTRHQRNSLLEPPPDLGKQNTRQEKNVFWKQCLNKLQGLFCFLLYTKHKSCNFRLVKITRNNCVLCNAIFYKFHIFNIWQDQIIMKKKKKKKK